VHPHAQVVVSEREAFCEEHNAVARDVVLSARMSEEHRERAWRVYLLERLADDALGLAVRVRVGRVPRRHAAIPRGLQERKRLRTR
jgi:hypothetical protein